MYKISLSLLTAALLAACSSAPQPSRIAQVSDQAAIAQLPSVNLPISASKWSQWQCPRGETLRTRYQDSNAQQLIVVHQQREYVLKRQASTNPIIYSDGQTGFYSNGYYAALGKAYSDEVRVGGCIPPR
ncbi:MliC family protein [Suttonella sp. R2A3]|uniref:MliC family protein n=1 Tax=Suttonella sp. R2A3 TaxID=2908648 RepID=UPI001F48419F|nr:MliC family protein [Suttonella sp. R2A3]UJF24705.1 MliC family protein [Suttonella sp. R2A3]